MSKPHIDRENSDPSPMAGRAPARTLLAAGASLVAGASLAAAPAATAGTPTQLGVASHKRIGSHKRATRRAKPAPPVPSPELLAAGSTGPAVQQLQRALHRYATGYFGSGTRRAVVGFQRHRHLSVDGVVGPQTRRALHLRVRIIAPPPPPPAPAPAPAVSSTPTVSTPADPAPATATAAAPAPRASSGYSGGYSIPGYIVQCESGGNWTAVNPSSGAGGAYQIMPSTWQAYGGTGTPQDASPAQQSAIAAKIWASSGPGAWQCAH